MTLLLSDAFTGSNGAALSANWTTGYTGAGASTAIQSNRGRWTTGTAGGYSGTARISRRAVISSCADVEISGTYTPQGDSYPEIYVRASDTAFDTGSGYSLRLPTQGGPGNLRIYKYVSYTGTSLVSSTISATSGTTYGFRFLAIGTSLKGKIWAASGPEPSAWTIEVTDSTITAAGNVGFSVGAGNTASTYVGFDDVVITNGVTDVALDETITVSDGALSATATVSFADTVTVADSLTVAELVALGGDTATVSDSMSVEIFQLRHDLVTEIEFTPGEWVDVSVYVSADVEATGVFGRQTRFDDIAASTWHVTLSNSDGRFTPGNPSSPYYPNVAKGKQLRVSVVYAGQTYPRFWGQITAITLPAIVSVESAVVDVQAADVMATLARKTLMSPFVEESRRQARQNTNGGVDVFPFPPSTVKADGSVQVADTSFENKGVLFPGSTRMGTISIVPAANGAGVVKSASTESDGGVLSEGQLDFEVGDNGSGKQAHPVLVAAPQVGFKQFELFFKIPEGVLPPIYKTGTYTVPSNGDGWNTIRDTYKLTFDQLRELNPELADLPALSVGQIINIADSTVDSEWVLAQFWAGSTEVFRICLVNVLGKLVVGARRPGGQFSFVFGNAEGTEATIADGKWHKLTAYKYASGEVRCNINDLPTGGTVGSLSADMTAFTTVVVGGRFASVTGTGQQTQCPPISVGGVAFQATRTGVWTWYCLGAPPANVTASERFLELTQYAAPISLQTGVKWHPSLNQPFDAKVVRTNITGRSVLDCMQELARTMGAYLWVQPEDGKLTMRKGPMPPLILATVDLTDDADDQSPPQWRDSVDVQPTRVTAKCPAGEITSVNSSAESAGQYKDATVSTCAPTVSVAKSVADRYVSGQASLHLTNLQVDLVHAAHALHGVFLPSFQPTETALRITSVPEAVIGHAALDAVVESWSESYTIDSARFAFETTPLEAAVSAPPLASFTVTSTTGTQDGGTISAPQPAGTSTGDLLAAIMTVDDTGSLAGMTAPSGWVAQGTGGSGAAGHGKVWTKTAGAAEPVSYGFTAAGTVGTSTLMTSGFDGTGAWDSSKWTPAETRTGASATKADGAGVLNPGTGTGYTGRVSVLANVPDKADVDLVLSFKFGDNDSFFTVMLRGNDVNEPGSNGYEVRPRVGSSGCKLSSISNFTATSLGTISGTLTAGTWYRLRCQTIGTHVRVRLWPAASPEPSSWGLDVTNSAWTAAGNVALVASGGNTAAARIYIDDVTVSDPNATNSIPEAKLTVMRVAGADVSDPLLVAPVWQANDTATTSHVAPSVAPASTGLLVNHWHTLVSGAGTGGGSEGGAGAFSFGMSRFSTASEIDAANAWLTNHSLKAVGFWTDVDASTQQEVWGLGSGEPFGAYTGIVDIAIGGVFGSETWAQAASGSFDSRWTTSLNTVKTKWGSRPPGNLHLRFAHEFNGDWSDWYVTSSNAAAFVSAWRRWAGLVRSILPGVQIAWSPNDGFSSGAAPIDSVWPGSDYVDVVAPDSYNAWPHVTTKAEADAKMLRVDANGNPEGLERWRQWALGKGKPLALGEWGNKGVDVGDGGGGGDHPVYAEQMLIWMKANGGYGPGQIKYAIYFNHGPQDGYEVDYEIWPATRQPLTAAAIRNGA